MLTLQVDVTDEQAAAGVVAQTVEAFGRIDIVVNAAGLMLLGPIVEGNTDDWRRMMDTNVLGLMYVTHAAVPHLVKQGSGDVINVSSVAGRTAKPGSGVYNASKWAVNAFSESLRQEVTTNGVRVTFIEPGAVDTELNALWVLEEPATEGDEVVLNEFDLRTGSLRESDVIPGMSDMLSVEMVLRSFAVAP